jgi:hypothetical protein
MSLVCWSKGSDDLQGLFRYLSRLITKAVFRLTDENKNGKLESIEIEIAILQL